MVVVADTVTTIVEMEPHADSILRKIYGQLNAGGSNTMLWKTGHRDPTKATIAR